MTVASLLNRIRWGFSVLFLAWGVYVYDSHSLKWTVITFFVFGLPLLSQFIPVRILRVGSLWMAFFLWIQSLFSPLFLGRNSRSKDFITLPYNMYTIVDVQGDGLPGIQGPQHIRTDAMGFRSFPKVDYKNKQGFRIFAMGGSTTEQIYLDDKSTWTTLLQEKLKEKWGRPVEVIGTGVSGTRIRHQLATFIRVLKLEPDMAIFLLGVNDWNQHIRDHFSKIEDFERRENVFLLRNSLLGKMFYWYLERNKFTAVKEKEPTTRVDKGEYYAPRRNSLTKKPQHHFQPEAVSEEFSFFLNEIGKLCDSSQVKCVFLTQPTGYKDETEEEYRKGFWMTPTGVPYSVDFESMKYISDLYNQTILTWAKQEGHKAIDMASVIEPSYQSFYDDCHFNTQGALTAGTWLADQLVDEVD